MARFEEARASCGHIIQPPQLPSLQPGVRLGPYEFLSALGAGGTGEVYQPRDTTRDRDGAITILPDPFQRAPHSRCSTRSDSPELAPAQYDVVSALGVRRDEGGRSPGRGHLDRDHRRRGLRGEG